MTYKPPAEWSDPSERGKLAQDLSRQIDAYNSSMEERVQQWQRTQDVYDETLILTSLNFLDNLEPYNVSLLPQRCDGLAEAVIEPIVSVDPYFIVKGRGGTGQNLADVQSTLHYAMEIAGYERKLRETALMASLRGRGMLRLRYESITEGLLADEVQVNVMGDDEDSDNLASPSYKADRTGEVQPKTSGNPDVRYSGLIIDSFKPEDCVVYPTYSPSIQEARIVGHRFLKSRSDLIERQDAGIYFEDIIIPISNDMLSVDTSPANTDVIADSVIDGPLLCYDLVVKLTPPGKKGVKRYRCTLLKNTRQLLAIEEYDLPTVWYFSPGYKYDLGSFWNTRSVGDRLIEPQTIYNDAYTLIILCAAAGGFANVAVSNWMGESTVQSSGLAKFTLFKGDPKFFPIPTNGTAAQYLTFLCENLERVADSLARLSQAGLGQQFANGTTATEVNNVVAGQQQGLSTFSKNFCLELERMADLGRWLLDDNWKAFKDYHGDAVSVTDPKELRSRCRIECNGKGNDNTPQTMLAKFAALIQGAQQLGIQPIPSDIKLNTGALFQAMVSALGITVSTENIIEDPNAISSDTGPAQNEILAGLLRQLQGGMAGPPVQAPNAGMPPGAIPPGPMPGAGSPPIGAGPPPGIPGITQ